MYFDDLFSNLLKLPNYIIEIGIFSDKTERKKKKQKKDIVQVGLTNSEIMFINENGSPLRHIPKRPVLQMTIDWANKELVPQTISKCIDLYIESNFDETVVEQELKRMCMRMENYARKIIYSNDGRLPRNAQSTIDKKGVDHPLFDTGQLARSITCRLVKV